MESTKKLIMVTGDNNNKYYDMNPNADGSTWTAKWGRVGVTESTQVYPMDKWDSKYREKVKKGYKDVTEMYIVSEKKDSSFLDISDKDVKMLLDALQRYASKSISDNYTVSSESVTYKQVEEAQRILDRLTPMIKMGGNISQINENLLELYQVIPRKMKNVKYHIFDFPKVVDRDQLARVQTTIADEQATLDVMSGQVTMQSEGDKVTDKGSVTLLDMMGIAIVPATADFSMIKKYMDEENQKFRRAFQVVNKRTQSKFDSFLTSKQNQATKLFWHGSRNENWLSIMEQGLVLRPTNAVRTGAMYGTGCYFADKCRKSMGYTSLSGSYWAKGSSNVAYLALYNVHVGNMLRIQRHESWCYNLSKEALQKRGNYDSVFAEKGADLRNNEFIIYNDNQSTIKYLIEVSG